ncbi:MAG: MBL fold metallo-hydrolase [Nibricoccus sp.]
MLVRSFRCTLMFVVLALTLCVTACRKPSHARWTMLNVQGAQGQADCHLLELPDGQRVLIDVAEGWDSKGAALSLLKARKIDRISLVVLSHLHWDHYGKLRDIIDGGVKVDRVALNLPGSRELADVEKPWGCNWEDVQNLLRFLSDRRIPYFIPRIGERLVEVKRGGLTTTLEAVCLYDGIDTPVGKTDINDTSIILRLTHGSTRVLFTGDLNQKLGAWLATSGFDLKADLLKMPHHGTEGLAPNEFFEKVNPKDVLIPSPRDLWFALRSKRAREWCAGRKIPAYVNGLCGTVVVEMDGAGYVIKPERPLAGH